LVRNDLDLAITLLGDGDGVAEVAGAAIDLDAIVKELLESLDVKDLIVDRLGAVDDELRTNASSVPISRARRGAVEKHTFFVTFWFFLVPFPAAAFYIANTLSLLFYAGDTNLARPENAPHSRGIVVQRTAKRCTYRWNHFDGFVWE
jgi:hypothetical protein